MSELRNPHSYRPWRVTVDPEEWLKRHDSEIKALTTGQNTFATHLQQREKAGAVFRWAVGLVWPVLVGGIVALVLNYGRVGELARDVTSLEGKAEVYRLRENQLLEHEEEIAELKDEIKALKERLVAVERFHPRRKRPPSR